MDAENQIRALRDAAARSLAELQEQVAPLLEEIERRKRELSLLDDLLRLRGAEPKSPQSDLTDLFLRRSPKNTSVVENAKRLFAEAGRPLHITEIRRIFLERGLPIPGQGKEANIIAHLTRSPEIQRIKRGFYTVADPVLIEPTGAPSRPEERLRRRLRRPRRKRRALSPKKISEDAQPGKAAKVD